MLYLIKTNLFADLSGLKVVVNGCKWWITGAKQVKYGMKMVYFKGNKIL